MTGLNWPTLRRRVNSAWRLAFWRAFLATRVTGRVKLRGDMARVSIADDFRCDGDLWLGVHSNLGQIVIENDVTASGPLIITAVRTLRIGKGTLFGPNVLVTDHYHGDVRNPDHRALAPSARPLHATGEVVIGDGVHLGANVVILGPAMIGNGAIVAANVVVKGIVPPGEVYTGRRQGGAATDRRPPAGEIGDG